MERTCWVGVELNSIRGGRGGREVCYLDDVDETHV